jgi:hypothetical protein
MTTIAVTHQRDTLGHVTIYDGLAGLSFKHGYSSTQLRAIAAALMEAADKLEPQKAMRWETNAENLARDIREGRFPNQSERQRIPDMLARYLDDLEDRLEPASEPVSTSEADKEVMRDALLYGMGIRKGETHIPLEECLNPANKPNITAWWEAYLAALTGLLANPAIDFTALNLGADLHATAAVEARRKMEGK